jgi:hypothetical protein
MQPSLEIAFWVALLTFPLIQIVLVILVQQDPDVLIRYLTKYGTATNLASFVPFLFVVIYAIVFLVSNPSGWNMVTAIIVGIVGILSMISLLQLQSFAADVALQKSIKTPGRRKS